MMQNIITVFENLYSCHNCFGYLMSSKKLSKQAVCPREDDTRYVLVVKRVGHLAKTISTCLEFEGFTTIIEVDMNKSFKETFSLLSISDLTSG